MKFKPKTFIKKNLTAVTVVASLAVIGAVYLTISHAASPYVAVSATTGTLASGACAVTDSGASGGSAVSFGGTGCSNGSGAPITPAAQICGDSSVLT